MPNHLTGLGCLLTVLLCSVSAACTASQASDTRETKAETEPTPYADILSSSVKWPDLATKPRERYWLDEDREATNRAVNAQLETVVTLHKDSLTLDQAIGFLRDTTRANVAVNWPALELAGIEQNTLASCHLNKVPARVFLQFILDQVSAGAFDFDKAGYRVNEGLIIISTLHDLRPASDIRVYDVRDLFTKPKLQASLYRNHQRAAELIALLEQDDWWSQYESPGFDLNDALSSTSSGGSPSNTHRIGRLKPDGERRGNKQADLTPLSKEEKFDLLAEIIQSTVGDPDEWLDEESTLTELNGNLIVKTTAENHRSLRVLLLTLRNSQTEHFKQRATTIEIFLLLQEAEEFRLKQAYKPALDQIDQALRIDPNQAEAKALRAIIMQTLSR